MFGEEDIINNCNRSFTISCSSQDGGELWIIDKKNFLERIMGSENLATKNYIQENATNKNKIIDNFVQK